MKSLKSFTFTAGRGADSSLNLDWATLFSGGTYHLEQGVDYNIPADLTGSDLTHAINTVVYKIKGKGRRNDPPMVVSVNKVGAAQNMAVGIVVQAEEADDETKAKWKEQHDNMMESFKARTEARKAAKAAGNGVDTTAASESRTHTAPAAKAPPAVPVKPLNNPARKLK